MHEITISRRLFLASAAAVLPAGARAAQEQTQQATFSTGVKVVNVFASARDKDGHIVKDLTKDDFTVLEDGRPQTLKYFSQQSDLPLILGLLVDTSGSERRMIATEKSASRKFIEQVLRPDRDKVFLIHFDREIELLQDLTSSREQLERALDSLTAAEQQQQRTDRDDNGGGGRNGGGGGYPGGGGGGGIGFPGGGGIGFPGGGGRRGGGGYPGGGNGNRRMRGGTAFYDAIYLASNEVLKGQTGRKALIMLTDGEDNGSKISVEEAISSAQRADAMGYAVRVADDEIGSMVRGWNGGGRGGGMDRPDGKKILKQISKETGGGYFEYGKKKALDDIYAEIQEELRNQYSLGYSSDKTGNDSGAFRKIEVKVQRKGVTIQARDGYYA